MSVFDLLGVRVGDLIQVKAIDPKVPFIEIGTKASVVHVEGRRIILKYHNSMIADHLRRNGLKSERIYDFEMIKKFYKLIQIDEWINHKGQRTNIPKIDPVYAKNICNWIADVNRNEKHSLLHLVRRETIENIYGIATNYGAKPNESLETVFRRLDYKINKWSPKPEPTTESVKVNKPLTYTDMRDFLLGKKEINQEEAYEEAPEEKKELSKDDLISRLFDGISL